MATNFYSVTLDGVTDFQSNEFYSWGGNKYIQHARFELDNGNDLDATFNLSGNNWVIEYFHVWSAAGGILRVNDVTNGGGRYIRHMTLQEDSIVSLDTTFVDILDCGSAASHDITLGSAGAVMVTARAGENRVVTGSGFVNSIQTGGIDTVHVYGGANSVNTGDQADEIGLFGGFTGLVEAGGGNDLFGTVGGDGGRVWLGDGEDRAFLLDGYVDLLGTGRDNDTVVANGGDAKLVQLGDGNDTLTVKGGSRIQYVEAGDGNATVTVEAGSRLDNLQVSNGTHTVKVQGDGRIREISGDDSTLTLSTGAGGVNQIDFWRSDTTINLGSGGAESVGLYSDQAQAHSFVSSGWVSYLSMGDGQTMNLTLTNRGAGLVELGDLSDTVVIRDGANVDFLSTREGNDNVSVLNDSWVGTLNLREGADNVLIENSFADAVRLGDGNDRLTITGNSFVRYTIDGDDGDDWLAGGNNNETFDGGNDNDTIIGGRGYDIATGGSGADIFAFVAGDDTLVITDFEQGVDQIAFVNLPAGFKFENLAPFVSQDGNDLTIRSGSQEVRLINTQLSDWSSDDVFFV